MRPVLAFTGALLLVATLVALSMAPGLARAASTSRPIVTSSVPSLSSYERDILETVLEERSLAIEPQPEGKQVESIDVETLDVFEKADPAPGWLNWFHVTTRPSIIEREILVRTGSVYDQRAVDESARNLRKLRQISLVLVVPIRAEDPKMVRLLVITKDVWSLRLNTAFSSRNNVIEHLALVPSEINLAGRHLALAAQYEYDLSTNTFGGTLTYRRLFGSRILTTVNVNAIQFRRTGVFEGSTGQFSFGQPLYSTRTKWAWGTALAWQNRTVRRLLPNGSGDYVPRLYRDATVPWADPEPYTQRALPYEYHVRQLAWRTYVTRSYGDVNKLNVSLGLEAQQSRYDAQGLLNQGYRADLVNRFEQDVLPRRNSRIGPFVSVTAYRNEYVSMTDLETLGLQEDVQTGPLAYAKAYSGTKRAMGTRDIVGLMAGAQFTLASSDALMRIWASHSAELSARAHDRDGLIEGGVHLVSPKFAIGRVVYNGGGVYHYRNALNERYALGGDSRLRGYPSKQFLGHHLVASNLEFRTRSVKILEVLFGLVGFYDVGDAFDRGRPQPKHSVGVGGRATFPQFQRAVVRLDLAFPLSKPEVAADRYSPYVFFLTVGGQAFPMPVLGNDTAQTPLLPSTE